MVFGIEWFTNVVLPFFLPQTRLDGAVNPSELAEELPKVENQIAIGLRLSLSRRCGPLVGRQRPHRGARGAHRPLLILRDRVLKKKNGRPRPLRGGRVRGDRVGASAAARVADRRARRQGGCVRRGAPAAAACCRPSTRSTTSCPWPSTGPTPSRTCKLCVYRATSRRRGTSGTRFWRR